MILIPAFQPNEKLNSLLVDINKIFKNVNIKIVVIDDGSSNQNSLKILKKIKKIKNVVILKHEQNMGKGVALKTGLRYAKKYNFPFVITADADGQHLPGDIFKLWLQAKNKKSFFIGVRNFDKNTPLRSLVGNKITSIIFRFITGKYLKDTQSGLRFIPNNLFNNLIAIKSNKYDFELDCLLKIASSRNANINTLEISTIYEVGNLSSHFRPIFDSTLVYLVFLRFSLVAILIALLDLVTFLILSILMHLSFAFIITRMFTIFIYFFGMKKIVFQVNYVSIKQKIGYVFLILFNILLTYIFIGFFNKEALLIKGLMYIIINVTFALFNFYIMKNFLFKYKN